MTMRVGYYAWAAPVALGATWAMSEAAGAPGPVSVGCGVLVLAASTWPGLVDARYKGRMHPGAALVRGTAALGYMVRTPKDRDRGDLDRGPTYCLEWCVLAGVAVALLAVCIPSMAEWALFLGGAAALGCAVHVVADLPTPTGVPMSLLWNVCRHGEVWRRHSLGWYATDSAGDMFLAFPALFMLTGLMGLAMLGLLGPLVGALTGW